MPRRAASPLHRRLTSCALLLGLAWLGAPAWAASATAEAIVKRTAPALVPLADGVWLQPGTFERGRQPDGNSLLLRGPQGVVVVDSGRHAEHAQALIDAQRSLGAPLRVVINTHWHLDHLGGNAMLRRAAPTLQAWASPALRAAIEQRMPRSEAELRRAVADPGLDADTRRMMEIDLGLYAVRDALRPDRVLDGADEALSPAGRRLRIGVLRGVSGGDLWLLDEASGLLAVGDFVTLPVPFFDTACAPQWREALARLEALPFERVVPGHGPLLSRAEFGRYRRAFDQLLDCAGSSRDAGECSAGWIADLGPLLPAGSERVVRGMLGHYLRERLRAPAAERERDCVS